MQTCDKCGGTVKAYWMALKAMNRLYFCNHHKVIYKSELKKQGFILRSHAALKEL